MLLAQTAEIDIRTYIYIYILSSSEYIAIYCLASIPFSINEYIFSIPRRRTSRYEKILSFATNTRGISRWQGWIFLADSFEKVATTERLKCEYPPSSSHLYMYMRACGSVCMCTPYLRICHTRKYTDLSYQVCIPVTERRLRIINLSFQSCASTVRSIRRLHRWHNRWPLIVMHFPSCVEKIYTGRKVVRNFYRMYYLRAGT